jgi:hypothetical protein
MGRGGVGCNLEARLVTRGGVCVVCGARELLGFWKRSCRDLEYRSGMYPHVPNLGTGNHSGTAVRDADPYVGVQIYVAFSQSSFFERLT